MVKSLRTTDLRRHAGRDVVPGVVDDAHVERD
jgi:hypothetical protein